MVTGAGSGLGSATALALAEAGYRVALVGRRAAALDEVRSRLDGDGHLCLPADVTLEADVARAFEAVIAGFGRLDLLFNNAGQGSFQTPIEDVGLESWRQVIDVNLTGAFLCLRAAFRVMKAQRPGGGRIINNGSVSAHSPRPNAIAYTASKHGMTGLTKAASLEGRKYGIACGQIDIGNASSAIGDAFPAGMLQADGSIAPEPTIDAALVGRAVCHMASLPLDANVQFMTVMATCMPYIGRG